MEKIIQVLSSIGPLCEKGADWGMSLTTLTYSLYFLQVLVQPGNTIPEFLEKTKAAGARVIKGSFNEKTVYFIHDFSDNRIEIKPLLKNLGIALFRNLLRRDCGDKPAYPFGIVFFRHKLLLQNKLLGLLQTSNVLILCDFFL